MEKINKKLISIVSPAYNEAENIPLIVEEVKRVMVGLKEKYDFEYILVSSLHFSLQYLRNILCTRNGDFHICILNLHGVRRP